MQRKEYNPIADMNNSKKLKNISVRHCAPFSAVLLPVIEQTIEKHGKGKLKSFFDPFGGIGRIKEIIPNCVTNELEIEWALMSGEPGIVGDALKLAFSDETFDCIITSPCYGNRMADSFTDHKPEKNYVRNTYTHSLGRKLDPRNAGQMQWGEKYRETHSAAWLECFRVLKFGGLFVLNISDHIRNKKQVYVSQWHLDICTLIGFYLVDCIFVKTQRNCFGENRKRVEHERIYVFKKELPF